jgi:alkanesulfonate monooxygenase SsuD/methylene tetrahydromethanopterin reductase-like flavin-dependent oxidoreductase (luciferase family)
VFLLRFDMRAARAEHYRAAVEMARWAQDNGAMAVVVSEHHASEDGYLPSPLTLASAMAAVTSSIAIQIAALIVPLHDPVRLAEDMAVLDLLSQGRVSYVCGAGYRDEEFAMFGQELRERGRRLEKSIAVMRRAWTGEPFEYEGRPCLVTPAPHTPGGPMLMMGGGSPAAVRRAVRLGMGMLTERSAGLTELYESECAKQGVVPQLFIEAPSDAVTAAFVAEDPDAYWARIGPYLLHDARMYHSWNEDRELPTSITAANTIEALRQPGSPYRVFTPDEAVAEVRAGRFLNLHPMCGGIPPDDAWTSLELLRDAVLPEIGGAPG